jgi:hypothetical protein
MVETDPPAGGADRSSPTADEREALRLALRRGYFAVPRATTLAGLSDGLNRSDVRTSEAMRRGVAAVLRRPGALEPPPTDARADGGGSARLDRMFDALRHPYRRRILLLVGEDNPRDEEEFSVDDVATEDDDLELFTVELYHAHLPKLADAGYVEWDEDTHTVRQGPNFDEIAPLLRLIDAHRDELPDGWP